MKTKIFTITLLVLFVSVNVVALNMSAVKKLRMKENTIDGVTWGWYKSTKTPQKDFKKGNRHFDYDNTMFYLFIGIKNKEKAFLQMYVQVEPNEEFIKFNKIQVNADGEQFEKNFDIKTLKAARADRDQLLEFYTAGANGYDIMMLEKMAAGKNVTIIYKGAAAEKKFKLGKKDKKALKDVLEAWKKLNS